MHPFPGALPPVLPEKVFPPKCQPFDQRGLSFVEKDHYTPLCSSALSLSPGREVWRHYLRSLNRCSWNICIWVWLIDWLIDWLIFLRFSKLPHNSHSRIEKNGTLSPKDKARGEKKISWFRLTSTWYWHTFKLANINYTLGTCPELLWEKQGWHFSVFVPYRLTQKTWSTLRVGWIRSAYFTEK